MYVHVNIFVPEQTGSGPTNGPITVSGAPQFEFTTGGIGTVCALIIQATVEPPLAGSVKDDGEIV
jgi:hypothetical protein